MQPTEATVVGTPLQKPGARARVPVVIELGTPLASLQADSRSETLSLRLAASLNSMLQELGIPGDPDVSVRATALSRAVRVRVNEKLLRYSPAELWRAWVAVAPYRYQHYAALPASPSWRAFPDHWLADFLASESTKDPRRARGLVLDFIHQLALDTIRIQASCLLGRSHLEAYVGPAPDRPGFQSRAASALEPVLTALLDLGVSIADRDYFLALLDDDGGLRLARDAAAEIAFSYFRARSVEVHIDPGFAAALVSANSEYPVHVGDHSLTITLEKALATPLKSEVRALSNELGLTAPRFTWSLDPRLPERGVAVKINSLMGPPMVCMHPGEVLVEATPEQLGEALGVQASVGIHPHSGCRYALLDARDAAALDGHIKFHTLTSKEAIARFVRAEVDRGRERLVGGEEIAARLNGIQSAFPKLGEIAVLDLPVWWLTRIVRQLVRERIPVRDWRRFLECLLEMDEPASSNWRDGLAFLRLGLSDLVCDTYCGGLDQRLQLYRLPGEFEESGRELTEDERERLFQQLWAAQSGLDRDHVQLAVLTSNTPIRDRLYELLRRELPLPVLAEDELEPGTREHAERGIPV